MSHSVFHELVYIGSRLAQIFGASSSLTFNEYALPGPECAGTWNMVTLSSVAISTVMCFVTGLVGYMSFRCVSTLCSRGGGERLSTLMQLVTWSRGTLPVWPMHRSDTQGEILDNFYW